MKIKINKDIYVKIVQLTQNNAEKIAKNNLKETLYIK